MKNGRHHSCVETKRLRKSVHHDDRRVATNGYWLANTSAKTVETCHCLGIQAVLSEVPGAIDRGAITFKIRYSHLQNWRLHRYIPSLIQVDTHTPTANSPGVRSGYSVWVQVWALGLGIGSRLDFGFRYWVWAIGLGMVMGVSGRYWYIGSGYWV